jgi:hypothetical protein
MQQSRSRQLPFLIATALISVCVAAKSGFAQTPPAASQTLPATAQMPSAGTQAPAAGTQAPAATTQVAPAPQPLTEAELKKVNGLIADQGRDVGVDPMITDILGLTANGQAISCRAFAAFDARSENEIHQIYLLPDAKGYLVGHFYKDKVDVYLTDKDFALISALAGVRGERPATASFQDAQYGFGFERTWWANFADTH